MPMEGAFHHLIASYQRQDKRSKGNGCAIQHDFMLLIVRKKLLVWLKNGVSPWSLKKKRHRKVRQLFDDFNADEKLQDRERLFEVDVFKANGDVITTQLKNRFDIVLSSTNLGGRNSLVVKVTDLSHEFVPCTPEDLQCRGGRCPLNMSKPKYPPIGVWKLGKTATAGSDVLNLNVQFSMTFSDICGRIPAGECCLPNGQAFVAYPHRPMTLHSSTENSLAVLNHKILEANSQVQNVKLGGHQTCLSINRLWHELCDMLRRLVGTTAPGHHDCSIQE
ncbi:uncharacterized protein TNCV_3096941 [Trichonephila clavipes]|uniref:Uncharacterized protein n=1 Tax=Trichonephila clavipes TaxID=2585209 RepID=A0A8X6VMM0_TRICX|nr:uncharacterized protein TNCV_3096941 [Trichonephila clavipes]